MKAAAAVALAVAGMAAAQNSSFIPSGISSSCTSLLESLDADTTLQSCVGQLLNITSAFTPSADGVNVTQSDINYALANMCKGKAGCSDSVVRNWLSEVYSSCNSELTSSTAYNEKVREIYDILYVFNPLLDAVCSVDSANQDYCINEIKNSLSNTTSSSNSSSSASASATSGVSNNTFVSFATTFDPVEFAAQYLYIPLTSSSLTKRFVSMFSRDAAQTVETATIVYPNATTYRSLNLPFLFLQPTMKSSQLCTPCTREVMVSYVKFESAYPYSLGISASPILGGQSRLWTGINSTCGSTFINAIMSEAGTSNSLATDGSSSSGAQARYAGMGGAVVALVGGASALMALL
uniref:Uncharacterized protein n=1 Tax=Tremella fuciformis TaxID=64657 RepID=D5KXY5_9TREE|nr:unknown [Tremella fuciformis]